MYCLTFHYVNYTSDDVISFLGYVYVHAIGTVETNVAQKVLFWTTDVSHPQGFAKQGMY